MMDDILREQQEKKWNAEEQVDRVACALWRSRHPQGIRWPELTRHLDIYHIHHSEVEQTRRDARAALDALREMGLLS